MCGRFLLNQSSLEQVLKIAAVPEYVQEQLHFGEIFPSMPSLILQKNESGSGLLAGLMTFGALAPQKKQRILNARAETVDQRWMFKKAFVSGRIAVVASAFYEWDAKKQKMEFLEPEQTMYLAGLALGDSFVIITRPAFGCVLPVHHRMPVIFSAGQAEKWILDSSFPASALLDVFPSDLECLPAKKSPAGKTI